MKRPNPLVLVSLVWSLAAAVGCAAGTAPPVGGGPDGATAADSTAADVDLGGDVGTPPADPGPAGDEAEPDAAVEPGDDGGPPPDVGPQGFDDHTVLGFADEASFLAFSDFGTPPTQCKFVLTRFQEGGGEDRFLDPQFYALHDEWYWFRLLNGQPVDGLPDEPLQGSSYPTLDAIRAALTGLTNLPLDLAWYPGPRLYSPRFYSLGLGFCPSEAGGTILCPRALGIGSVLHLPPNPERPLPDELWLFELELPDLANEAEITRFIERLEPVLPPEVKGKLRWLARTSEYQEDLAATIRAGGGPLAGRVALYSELVTPGDVGGYNPGITAGIVRRVPKGELGKASLEPTDIVLLEEVPDDVPPVAGIVTAVPQTPQAHFNLLAAARGTPNAYVAGVMEDPLLGSLSISEQPVILQVKPDQVRWQPMTDGQWQDWLDLSGHDPLTVTQIDVSDAPYLKDLTQGGLAEMKGLVPLIGGKSAGLMALLAFPAMPTPYKPIGLTIRGYEENVASIVPTLKLLLSNETFQKDRRVRFLLLDGHDAFVEANSGDPGAMGWLGPFEAAPPPGILADVLAKGGVREMVQDLVLDPAFVDTVKTTLLERFAALAKTQGLRFRSSSTAEDVEGFNAAGVYESETGFLYPEAQISDKDKKKTVERAIKHVWSSYWSFGAFEERRVAKLPHLAGNMGVLVEPRFQDEAEASNGVILFGLARDAAAGDRLVMTVNVQLGALSVTNPPPGSGAAPEIDKVERLGDGPVMITRVQPSTEVAAGTWILSDGDLTQMFDLVGVLTNAWLDQRNSTLTATEKAGSVVLDLEFRQTKPGWPELASGEVMPPRIVYKQVRPLSRPQRITSKQIDGAQAPVDVLAATRRVDKRVCQSAALRVEAVELYTDPAASLIDHAVKPFDARLRFTTLQAIPALGLAANVTRTAAHTVVTVTHPTTTETHWDLAAKLHPGLAAAWKFDTVTLDAGGAWSIALGPNVVSGDDLVCTITPLVVTPEAWLTSLLEP